MPTNLLQKISPANIKLIKFARIGVFVTLRSGMTLDETQNDSSLWTAIRAKASARLNRGDLVDLLMHDGLTIAKAVLVLRKDVAGV